MTAPVIDHDPANSQSRPGRMHLSAVVDHEALTAAAAEGRREITGLAVPYDVEIDRTDWWYGTQRLAFAQAAAVVREDAKLFYGHDTHSTPIGRITASEQTSEGLRITATLSKTPKADEVYELLRDGTLDKFSIGFIYGEFAIEDDGELLRHTLCDVYETSVVPYPAYDGAAVDSVLSQHPTHEGSNPMTAPVIEQPGTDSLAQLAASQDKLAEAIAELERKLATLGGTPAPESPAALFGSYGEFVKGMLNGDESAQRMALAFESGDGVAADAVIRDAWVGDIIKLIDKGRKVWGLFDSGTLPAEGTSLEYAVLDENTIDVARQLAEGDDLVKGNIKISTDKADVLTFGGVAEYSLQKAQRSSVNVLELYWRALVLAYARATEAYARAVLTDVAAATKGSLATLGEPEGWIDFLVDAALHLDDKGLQPEYLRLSPDVYKGLATMQMGPDGPFFLDRSSGRVNVAELSGEVGGIRVVLTPGTNTVEVGNSFALKTYESGGAPMRLGPETEITNLTQGIGVYGFGAIAVQDPKAIVRIGA